MTKNSLRRINSLIELQKLIEFWAGKPRPEKIISLSSASCGRASGALKISSALDKCLRELNLTDRFELKLTGCHGFCQLEPDLVIFPEGYFYPSLYPEQVPAIVEKTLLAGEFLHEFAFKDQQSGKVYSRVFELPLYQKQLRWLLDAHLDLDPLSLEDYFAHQGFSALRKVLTWDNQEKVIDLITASGLRGRGGAGFPTGLKWRLARNVESQEKYLVCNGDEGDPGAYMDRGLLESNPFSVVEGMIIGGYAIGARKGFIYIRQEYPLAIERMEAVLRSCRQVGLLGEKILGTEFSFDLEIIRGAGAFVSGEETALIASIEGRRAFPRQRPPFPVVRGLFGQPTVINNVETWANVPLIIRQGPEWYSQVGTTTSKGTKIFSLVGQVRFTGLVEVPLGISIGEVVQEIGGGAPAGRKIKAVQTGGPSGGCLPTSMFNLPLDYEALQAAGTIMGSGGMIVLDDSTCLVDLALYFLKFASGESCGKCAPCRLGTVQMVEILERITRGEAQLSDLDRLEKLGRVMQKGSLCGLGRTAANPVLSGLRYFREEFETHVVRKQCPALVCRKLITYAIDREKCRRCYLCLKNCPFGAIKKEADGWPYVDEELCQSCGLCLNICPKEFDAIFKKPRYSEGGEGRMVDYENNQGLNRK
ncbi:MAG: NADH-quinone oxidoreductase subunit NuoF [Candidatus Aminicenantes bacterium]|nr:NADH-quinone oxidoreductase subunit NuoF [Candidatus Aminicenantes bacterium]